MLMDSQHLRLLRGRSGILLTFLLAPVFALLLIRTEVTPREHRVGFIDKLFTIHKWLELLFSVK